MRLIISLPPREKSMAARARKRAQLRRKKGKQANLASAWWAGVMLLGTTLPKQQWSAQDAVRLYRARWQVELLFKRIKQAWHLHLVPVKLWEHAQASVHLCLIVWSLQEQETQQISELLADLLKEPLAGNADAIGEVIELEESWVISHWEVARCELETLQHLLRGSWGQQRLRDCLPDLQRSLVRRHRHKRPSQAMQVKRWLCQQLATSQKEALAT